MEIWKNIIGYEGSYQISSQGNVRSLDRHIKRKNGVLEFKRGQPIVPQLNVNRYWSVGLRKNNKVKRAYIHRLVCEHFIKNHENHKCVNHKDGNPNNNNVENLEWVSYSMNLKHSYEKLGRLPNRATGTRKKTFIKFDNGKIKEFKTLSDTSKFLGLSETQTRRYINNYSKKGGFIIYQTFDKCVEDIERVLCSDCFEHKSNQVE